MANSEATIPAPNCSACHQLVRTFEQWLDENCPARTTEPPAKSGHQITWAERATLPIAGRTPTASRHALPLHEED